MTKSFSTRLWISGALLTGLAFTASPSWAQKKGRRVIQITETRIEGRIQKPQAFYILQRSNLNFRGLHLKSSFLSKVVKSVEKGPF